jgi:hypothetical protein
MTQTRITLNPQVKLLADDLLQLTGVANLSNLLSIFITRYGNHLKNTWVITGAMQQSTPLSQQASRHELPPSYESAFEVPQSEDPVIMRIARLIEDF